MTSSFESSRKNIEDRKRELTRMRGEWLDPINELVSKINKRFEKYFEAMGCAGEISLDQGGGGGNQVSKEGHTCRTTWSFLIN